jgi:hypothetical protein
MPPGQNIRPERRCAFLRPEPARIMLKLRSIGLSDYAVLESEQRIGRIRLATGRMPCVWLWSVTVHPRLLASEGRNSGRLRRLWHNADRGGEDRTPQLWHRDRSGLLRCHDSSAARPMRPAGGSSDYGTDLRGGSGGSRCRDCLRLISSSVCSARLQPDRSRARPPPRPHRLQTAPRSVNRRDGMTLPRSMMSVG